MKAIFLVLLFPSLAYGFYEDIPFQKTEICEKIKNDYDKAFTDFDNAIDYIHENQSNKQKAIDNIAKAFKNKLPTLITCI